VFTGIAGIDVVNLGEHRTGNFFGNLIKPDKGGVAYRFKNVVFNIHSKRCWGKSTFLPGGDKKPLCEQRGCTGLNDIKPLSFFSELLSFLA